MTFSLEVWEMMWRSGDKEPLDKESLKQFVLVWI